MQTSPNQFYSQPEQEGRSRLSMEPIQIGKIDFNFERKLQMSQNDNLLSIQNDFLRSRNGNPSLDLIKADIIDTNNSSFQKGQAKVEVLKKRYIRKVRFHDRTTILRQDPPQNYGRNVFEQVFEDEDVVDPRWYNAQEYEEFKEDIRRTARAVSSVKGNASKLNSFEYCTQGIEIQMSPSAKLLRKMRIKSTIRVVLDQQLLQRKSGLLNPESLAALYTVFTEEECRRAREAAASHNHI